MSALHRLLDSWVQSLADQKAKERKLQDREMVMKCAPSSLARHIASPLLKSTEGDT
jgi:hypothetical protein